jgi:hypothetical protein
MMVRYCDRCGAAMATDARFCASCGSSRPAEPGSDAVPGVQVQPAPPPVQPSPPPVSASAPGYAWAATPPLAAPAPPPVVVSSPMYAQPVPPPVQPAPSPVQPVPTPWPTAAPGAVPGWNPAEPARKRGRGCSCGCAALFLLLVVAGLVGLAAIGGAFDDLLRATGGASPATPGGGADLPAATTPLAGTITPGEEQPVGSETSDPGSTVTLNAPEDGPVPGLELRIPAGAYAAPVEFKVSASPVTVTGYGGMVTALSDLITVDNGGAYAASPMTVTIPVTIPAGMFAMGFFRHDDGTLEAMPLVDETPTEVTVATRHFSSFLVLAVAEAALPENIGTGFRAGEDDFQAPNYGSYAAPYGACAGQSIGAIWYFLERKANGAPDLWGLTDNLGRGGTIPFWRDDRSEYRLTSSIQRAIDWTSLSSRLMIAVTDTDSDRLQWDAFRYAMLVTGHPQLVGLSETGQPGGHAIVSYAATPTGLWVADPNHPGKLRNIAWNAKAGRFDPYASGPTAADSEHFYDIIGLEAETAFIDWAAVGALWAATDAGTIGDDRFPLVPVMVKVTAADGTKSDEPLRSGPIPTTQPLLGIRSVKGATLRVTFYNGTEPILTVDADRLKPIRLGYGINDLGAYVESKFNDKWRFVDFQRFELVAPAPSGTPTIAPSTPAPEPTFDCSEKPDGGIAGIEWSLHCEGIGQPILPQDQR